MKKHTLLSILVISIITIPLLSACGSKPEKPVLPGPFEQLSGQISDVSGPVTGATITIDHLADQVCVQLISRDLKRDPSNSLTTREEDQLIRCLQDSAFSATTQTDETGRYVFENVPAGSYRMVMGWKLAAAPADAPSDPTGNSPLEFNIWSIEYQDDYLIQNYVRKGGPIVFEVTIYKMPFFFSAESPLSIDFNLQP